MSAPPKKIILAGLLGGAALNAAMLLTFRLLGFGWNGGGVLLDPSVQSPKLIDVWTRIEPLPLVVSNPLPIAAGLFLFSTIHSLIYAWSAPSWPAGVSKRALRLAALIFFLSYLFWEFFTPFNQFGEPFVLIGLELVFWMAIALAESFAITLVMERW